jgi:hypothetical protein
MECRMKANVLKRHCTSDILLNVPFTLVMNKHLASLQQVLFPSAKLN